VKAAGLEVSRVEVETSGKLVIVTSGPNEREVPTALEEWLATNARHS
jgi:hypothetical protein